MTIYDLLCPYYSLSQYNPLHISAYRNGFWEQKCQSGDSFLDPGHVVSSHGTEQFVDGPQLWCHF